MSGDSDAELSPEEVVIAYHERTKHHFHRYAESLGYLDWATQPDPFRRYAGTDRVRLPLPPAGRSLPYDALYSPDTIPSEPLSVESVSLLLRYALSLTAWKTFHETTWSLRANPSSGNLHPTEGYLVLPRVERFTDIGGVYHYAPREHALECRATFDDEVERSLFDAFGRHSFFIGLSSIHWREAWKYGERAFRYCQHDAGHALAALRIGAATLGWRLTLLRSVSDDAIARLLGLDRDEDFSGAEREAPDCLALVTTEPGTPAVDGGVHLSLFESGATWFGKASVLSEEHRVEWPVIDGVIQATRRLRAESAEDFSRFPSRQTLVGVATQSSRYSAEQVILGRRSAVAMDGSTSIALNTFVTMLARLVPAAGGASMPWDAIDWRPRIHLGLFVHRVDGLAPGLYALVRDPGRRDAVKEMMGRDFLWQQPASCPPALPLYLLQEGDCRALASRISCGQDIAGDGAFSLGMIADFTDSLLAYGAPFYRNLFWEAGMVGQVLYLEAEAAGIRATGIGCYFDNPVRDVFGITSHAWQSFYHFTVGGPVSDARLTTLPGYRDEDGR
jgi:SagB-type dehydrogenase family enzyme